MKDELERIQKEAVVTLARHYPSIFPDGNEKITNFSQGNQCFG
jgi:hypothetical protein